MAGKLFLISAPSGAGKTTLVELLIERYGLQYNLERVITYTSKMPRPGELNGVHYNFITASDFEDKIRAGFFMEWSGVYQAYYGSPIHIMDNLITGRSYILIVDRVGAEHIIAKYPGVVSIWIYTKSLQVLRDRLDARNMDSSEATERRLSRAADEIALEVNTPIYAHHLLNHDFNDAFDHLVRIIKRELY